MASARQKSPPFEFRGKDLGALLSSPLVALARANERLATEQLKLLMEICFYERGDAYCPVMITMLIQSAAVQPEAPGGCPRLEPIVTEIQVPLITLLPINSLAVEDFEVSFEMDVHSQLDTSEAQEGGPLARSDRGPKAASVLMGKILGKPVASASGSSHEREHDTASGVVLNASVGTLPLPVGMATIIQAFSKAIIPATPQGGSIGQSSPGKTS